MYYIYKTNTNTNKNTSNFAVLYWPDLVCIISGSIHIIQCMKRYGKLEFRRKDSSQLRFSPSLFRYTVPGCYSENGEEVEVDIRSTHKATRVNSSVAYEARGF